MKNDIISRAIRARTVSKIKKSVISAYGITEIALGVDRRIAIDPKRAAVWCMYYYTNLPLTFIGEQFGCSYCNVLYLIRTMNGLISSDYDAACKIMSIEDSLVKKGLKKKNRKHYNPSVGDGLKFATSYKQQNKRPVVLNRKVKDILLATNDRALIESFLKGKREQIEKTKELDKVVLLAKEIKSLEYQLQNVC